jgi:hypothetical protein
MDIFVRFKVFFILGLVLLFLQFLSSINFFEQKMSNILDNSLPAFISLIALIAGYKVFKQEKEFGFWRYIFITTFLFFLAELTWAFYYVVLNVDPSETLTIAELFYILGYFPLIYAFFSLWKKHELTLSYTEITLIFFIIMIISVALTYVIFYLNKELDIIDYVYLTYPLLDLIVLGLIPFIFRTISKINDLTIPYVLINLSFGMFFASDFLYNSLVWNGISIAESPLAKEVNFIYVLSYFFLISAYCYRLNLYEEINEKIRENIKKKVKKVK